MYKEKKLCDIFSIVEACDYPEPFGFFFFDDPESAVSAYHFIIAEFREKKIIFLVAFQVPYRTY